MAIEYNDKFQAFFQNLLIDEGGYVPASRARNINDAGEATKYGISLKFLRSLHLNESDLNHDGIIDENDIVILTESQAKELYFLHFWNPLYARINNVQLAYRLFNFGVNAGTRTAVRLLQEIVNETLMSETLLTDGVFGINSLNVVNGFTNGQKLYDNYIIRISEYYKSLHKPQFLSGWLNRLKNVLPDRIIKKLVTNYFIITSFLVILFSFT